MDHPHLEVKNLTLQHNGREILNIEQLSVCKGELFVIIGPNGAGKSTLLRILDFLKRPSSGEILIDGEKVDDSSNKLVLRRKMAMVFQDSLLFSASVFENVAYGLKARKCPRDEISRRVKESLAKLNISHLAERKASELSGGEAQRVSLARALVLEPEILFLDEPFTSLDPPTREALRMDLEQLVREEKLTTVYVTHDRTEAIMLADRVAVMIDGEILHTATPEEVFNFPKNEEVARFVGMETILAGTVVSFAEGVATVQVEKSSIEVVTGAQVGKKVVVCIRPEEVTVTVDSGREQRETSARNRFHGQVIKLTRLGALVKVSIDCGFPLASVVTKQSAEQLGLKVGQEITANFKATAIHVIPKSS